MFQNKFSKSSIMSFSKKAGTSSAPLEPLPLSSETDEFFDALCSPCSDVSLKSCNSDMGQLCSRSQSSESFENVSSKSMENGCIENGSMSHSNSNMETNSDPSKRKRRTIVPSKAEHGFSLWSLIKHCIGKDLTKIPLPVYFNEPLSTLQRLTEEYEYAELLHQAAQMEDCCEQLVYIAAFVISSYSSASKRTGKPFNPLLGETFECDRSEDLGWRCFSEQVSHHPPVLAQHCEGKEWVVWQEFSMVTKLKGTSLQVNPIGINHLKFTKSGHHFTWNKVSTTVHNLVIGTLWLDHHGEIKIQNHATGDYCVVQFIPYRCFSPDSYRKVTGFVKDSSDETHWVLQGTWDCKIEAAPFSEPKSEDYRLIWKRIPPSVEDDKYYNLTQLACQLNEPEDGVAPTDSRLRPDQRLMEDGQWERANELKVDLEEKQRRKRHARDAACDNTTHTPAWFCLTTDEVTNTPLHVYTGEYWNCKEKADWSRCPDIFL